MPSGSLQQDVKSIMRSILAGAAPHVVILETKPTGRDIFDGEDHDWFFPKILTKVYSLKWKLFLLASHEAA